MKINNPRLAVGIDEFTLVLQPTRIGDLELDEWGQCVDDMLVDFLQKSRIEELFGPLEQANAKLQAGYTDDLTYTDRPWHFMICWHETFVRMGVCVKFSAFAYASYKQAFFEKYQTKLNIASFFRMVQSDLYVTRLSRIDLTADYFNYPDPLFPDRFLDPDSIYRRLLDGAYKIKNYKDKSTLKSFSALHRDGAYETFYAGSKKGKTNSFYDVTTKRKNKFRHTDSGCKRRKTVKVGCVLKLFLSTIMRIK